MKKIACVFGKICGGMEQCVGYMIFVAAVLAAVNAILRRFAGVSWSAAEEICTYLCVLSVFLGQPGLEITDGQLTIDIFNSTVKSEAVKQAIFVIRGIITVVVFALLFYAGLSQIQSTYQHNVVTNVLHIPRFLLYIVVNACYGMVILSWVAIFLNGRRPVKDAA